jgi:hypothetical protein
MNCHLGHSHPVPLRPPKNNTEWLLEFSACFGELTYES